MLWNVPFSEALVAVLAVVVDTVVVVEMLAALADSPMNIHDMAHQALYRMGTVHCYDEDSLPNDTHFYLI